MMHARHGVARIGRVLGALAVALACAACGRSTEPAAPDAGADGPSTDGALAEGALDEDAGTPTDAPAPCPADASPNTPCATSGDCCGNHLCQATRCCIPHDAACSATTECCRPGLCLGITDATAGTCLEPPH
jgi:hypothetical protein